MTSTSVGASVMFHHFTDANHPKSQGALAADELRRLIRWIGRERIVSASQWADALLSGADMSDRICLTFDDALRCQYDVALPVLREFDIQAFFFIYTGYQFDRHPPRLELYQYFRITQFADIASFYREFFILCTEVHGEAARRWLESFRREDYPYYAPYYSFDDCRFRELRDTFLGPDRYFALMDRMLAQHGVNLAAVQDAVMLSPDHIADMHGQGHVIGMHSHTHPTVLARLSAVEQEREYHANAAAILRITGQAPFAMSHPSNSYNADTLRILEQCGIRIGFRADVAQQTYGTLELPREDHSTLFLEMNQCA